MAGTGSASAGLPAPAGRLALSCLLRVSPVGRVGGILGFVGGRCVEQVYEKHAEELIRFATFLVGPADARDAVSAAMVKVLADDRWESAASVRAYLHRMVLNEVRMERRSATRRRAREGHVARREAAPARSEPRPEVLAAVARLSPRQRAVVYLTYWDDLTAGSVAARLGISEGAVRRHLARARQKLRRALDA